MPAYGNFLSCAMAVEQMKPADINLLKVISIGLAVGTAFGMCFLGFIAWLLWTRSLKVHTTAVRDVKRTNRTFAAAICGLLAGNLVFLYPPWYERNIYMHYAGPSHWRGFTWFSTPPAPLNQLGRVQVLSELMMLEYVVVVVFVAVSIYYHLKRATTPTKQINPDH